jgi:hypothetical protein
MEKWKRFHNVDVMGLFTEKGKLLVLELKAKNALQGKALGLKGLSSILSGLNNQGLNMQGA